MPSPPDAMVVRRLLTVGETHHARRTFGTDFNIGAVRIHNQPWILVQGRHTAMTPNGEVYFWPEDYVDDFCVNVNAARWLIHELTRARQFQHGRRVIARGLVEQASQLFGAHPYQYGKLDPAKPFDRFGDKQQAEIVADYFMKLHHRPTTGGSGSLDDYERAIPFAPKTVMAQTPTRAWGDARVAGDAFSRSNPPPTPRSHPPARHALPGRRPPRPAASGRGGR